MTTKVYSAINQKGGVGKTTTVQALAAGLTLRGFKVLMLDLDPQGNLSATLSARKEFPTIYEVIKKEANIKDAIIERLPWGDLVPFNSMLSTINVVKPDGEIGHTISPNYFKEVIQPLKRKYDFIFIDTPPSLSILTVGALAASDSTLIIAQAEPYSFEGLAQLLPTIMGVKEVLNNKLTIKGIMITQYFGRASISQTMADEMLRTANQLKTKLFKTMIRDCTAIRMAQAQKKSIFTRASIARDDYNALIDELLGQGEI